MKKAKIRWKKDNGETGEGSPISLAAAKAWIKAVEGTLGVTHEIIEIEEPTE